MIVENLTSRPYTKEKEEARQEHLEKEGKNASHKRAQDAIAVLLTSCRVNVSKIIISLSRLGALYMLGL